MTETVAVIVSAHLEERFPELVKALESLAEQTRIPDEVVVVIDGEPKLADRIRSLRTTASVVELRQPSGLAATRNAGVAACTSEIVLFLDDDAIAHPEWVERLASAISKDGVLGAYGYSAPIWGGQRPSWLPEEFLWTLGCSYAGQPVERTQVRNVHGGCCGLRRSLFTELGGYDSRLGRTRASTGGGEEAELCIRAQRRWPGSSFTFEPVARIEHLVPPSRLTLRYVLRRCYDEGRMKAKVASIQRGALTSERQFAMRLPGAFIRYLFGAPLTGGAGRARAGGVAVMVTAVTLGLLVERIGSTLSPRPSRRTA